jgi:threonine/homoserine/homoserine lactone efflux protein
VAPELYVRGMAIGFAVAFALGPIGLLVIRRTIERGWSYGLASGVGVATADAAYGAIAAFGLTAVTEVLVGIDRPLGIIGGAVLVVLSVRGMLEALRERRPPASSVPPDPLETAAPVASPPRDGRIDHRVAAWATMVGLTLTNPTTILSFAALFASIGAGTGGAVGAAAVVAGVFTGSVAWWILLTAAIAGLRARLTAGVVRALNVASSLVIGAFGLVAIGLGIAG